MVIKLLFVFSILLTLVACEEKSETQGPVCESDYELEQVIFPGTSQPVKSRVFQCTLGCYLIVSVADETQAFMDCD